MTFRKPIVTEQCFSLHTQCQIKFVTREATYHAETLWLFTRSDLKTVFLPQLALASANALSGNFVDTDYPKLISAHLPRLALTAFWIWSHLLLEVIANQRLPESIKEDSGNKPWRPLPSGRLFPKTATAILTAIIPFDLCVSYLLGETTLLASTLFCVFTWLYNDLGCASSGFVVRNILNASGLVSLSIGATAIAADEEHFSNRGRMWFAILWWIIFTTVQTQDLVDMEGDRSIDRQTMPLILGPQITRWSIAMPVITWSILCVKFWGTDMCACVALLLVCALLTGNVLLGTSHEGDRLSWRLWCLWMVVISILPLSA